MSNFLGSLDFPFCVYSGRLLGFAIQGTLEKLTWEIFQSEELILHFVSP